jgi:hypothetical protein
MTAALSRQNASVRLESLTYIDTSMFRRNDHALLVLACFSRHPEALAWATERLVTLYGPIALTSPDYDFTHTSYYEKSMGAELKKRFLVFDGIRPPDILPATKRATIALENELANTHRFSEARPLNLDPGLLQLGKFLLATTKDQAHRIYLSNGIYGEVTLRFQHDAFDVWPWTYADYREPFVRDFLARAREHLYTILATRGVDPTP